MTTPNGRTTVTELPFIWPKNLKFIKHKNQTLFIQNVRFVLPWTVLKGVAPPLSPTAALLNC
jgi:hypothetical protein